MANRTSQEQFPGWNQHEDIATNEFSIALDSNIDLQENLQPQVQSENLPDNFPVQDIQAPGMWTFETGTGPYKQFSEAGDRPPPIQTSPCFSATSVTPGFHTNSCAGSEIIAVNSGITPNYPTLQAPCAGAYHDFSSQEYRLSGGNFEAHQQLMSQQLGSEQSQLNHFPTTSFGVDNLQQIPGVLSGSSQLQKTLYGGIHTDSHVGFLSIPRLDQAQSSSSSFSPFGVSAATTSGCNYNLNVDANAYNQVICGDMDIQWNTECSLGNTLRTEFPTNPVHELGSSENPIEIIESRENAPKSQLSSTAADVNGPFPRIFGPSRPISLPPARRGGRKGPRSALELKNLRESRKQGVCIRCRKMKEKCHDGFPCKACRNNSNAILWKFLCTKAEFLGLLEHIEVFQKYTVERTNEKSFCLYASMTAAMAKLGGSGSKITAELPGVLQGPVPICWHRCFRVFADMCERMLQSQSKTYTARQLIETPYRLAHSGVSRPPIAIDDVYLSGAERERLSMMEFFCVAQFNVLKSAIINELPPEFAEAFDNNVAQVLENTVKLLAWVSRRYYEVMIFQSLQNASNRLESFSTDELSEIARALLNILSIGALETCNAEDSFLYMTEDSGVENQTAYDHRKQNIRQALFIYFSITLDKLPSGHDFWLLVRSGHGKASPDLSRHRLTDLEAFDWYYQREFMRAKLHMDLFYKEEVDSEGIRDPSNEEQYNPIAANLDFELRLGTLGEIFSGPRNAQADLEAVLKRFSEIYQPNIEEIERVLNMLKESVSNSGLDPSSSPIWQAVKKLVPMGRAIQQSLERQLEKQPGTEEPAMYGCDVDRLITEALEFMVIVDQIYSDVTTLMDGTSKMFENISE